jgi:pimeloyl-ACP methyl ester carboxylesterase
VQSDSVATVRRASVGREVRSGLYYEIFGPRSGSKTPILFIHGGGGTGANFRSTPDGRLGWADQLGERGYRVWVTDWPGAGRSGYKDMTAVVYSDIVDGYINLLRDVIAEPVVVVPHSMGGAVAWRLIEALPDLVAGVIALAAVHPANLDTPCELISDDGDVAVVRFTQTGVLFSVDRRVTYTYEPSYVYDQGVADSTQFPREAIPYLFAGHQGMSPRMLLQRVGLEPGLPVIENPDGFRGKRVRIMAGDRDPAHRRDVEERTARLLNEWGAQAQVIWLPDHGFEGNGHYLMGERNSDEVLELFVQQYDDVVGGG